MCNYIQHGNSHELHGQLLEGLSLNDGETYRVFTGFVQVSIRYFHFYFPYIVKAVILPHEIIHGLQLLDLIVLDCIVEIRVANKGSIFNFTYLGDS